AGSAFIPGFSAISAHECHSNFAVVACEVLTQTLRVTMASNHGLQMAELFEKFEVNSDPRWKVLMRLVGASLIVHLALLWMAVYIPALRDTLNIVALVAGSKFVDKPYDATQIGDNVQLVQVG